MHPEKHPADWDTTPLLVSRILAAPRRLRHDTTSLVQANGVAIYHLDEPSAGVTGGEYMVSTSIRGSPAEVLSVLMQVRAYYFI